MLVTLEVFIFPLIFNRNIITVGGASQGPTTNYCKIRCKLYSNMTHEVCRRSYKCNTQKNCTELEADDKFRRTVLNAHNDARNHIANGTAKAGRFPNIGAKNMHVLSYDLELEYLTSCAINECRSLHYSICYDSKRFSVGLNFEIVFTRDILFLWNSALERFYSSLGNVKSAQFINHYELDTEGFRETFIRLAWAETRYLGCSAVLDKSGRAGGTFACSYAPADYKTGSPVYKMANSPKEIASECRDGRNKKYQALCGQIEPMQSGLMWKYYQRKKGSSSSTNKIHCLVIILMVTVSMNRF